MDIIDEAIEESKPDSEFSITIEEIRELVDEAQAGWREIYEAAADDLKFYDERNQWNEQDKRTRLAKGRFTYTVNRLPQFVHQVANSIRQNTPNIRILPAGKGADIETAEVLEDLVRNIQYTSKANIAYDTGSEYAIKCGIGFIRLDHDYTAPDTFEQHILIKPVPNPLSVLVDPGIIGNDDLTFGIIFDTWTETKFKKQWPNAKPESFDTRWMSKNASSFSCDKNNVVVGEFFKLHPEEREIYQLETGEVVFAEQYEKLTTQPAIVNTRMITKNCCKRYLVTGAEILEEKDFPSSYIPIVPVFGEEHWIEGKRHLYSLIRNAKDTQRYYNYLKSLEIEMIKKAPKAPYIAAEGQLSGYEDQWRNPDESNVLIYKPKDLGGNVLGAPQRVEPILIQAGLVQAGQATIEDMKSTMGIYDPQLGSREGSKSGRAIIAEQNQGDIATYHYQDNLSRSVTQVGVIVIDMLPRVTDTARIMRVLGQDGTPREVAFIPKGQSLSPEEMQGIDGIYDISLGKYDVAVVTGPSFATKRQAGADAIMQLTQANPAISQIAGDLLVENLDFPNSQALAKRLKKAVPPQFLEEEEEQPDLRPQLAQAEQLIQAATQHIEQMQSEMVKLQQQAENDAQKNAIDAAKVQIDAQKLELERYKLAIEEQKNGIERDKMMIDTELEMHKTNTELEKHKLDTDSTIKQAQLSSPSYVDPDAVNETDEQIVALSEAVEQIALRVAEIGGNQEAIAVEMVKPKRIVPTRDANGMILYAEVVQ